MWCFMSNSSPGPQIAFRFKIRCMVPLKWQLEEFFLSAAAAFLSDVLRCLGGASGPGVCWSRGSTLNLDLNSDTAPVQKYLALSVLEFMVSDWEGSGYIVFFFNLTQSGNSIIELPCTLNLICKGKQLF